MSFYESRILPYLLNVFMNTKATREERQRSLAGVKGAVLEVGFGSGLNLPYYPGAVTKVVGVDLSHTSAHLARKRIAAASFPVEFVGLSAEKLPVADASFDSVVSTFTLCTIPDVADALAEMRRALKPEGRFYMPGARVLERRAEVRWVSLSRRRQTRRFLTSRLETDGSRIKNTIR